MPNSKIKQIQVSEVLYDIEPAETQEVNIIDNLTSESSTDVLAARQGKVLNDKISAIEGRGRYLSIWDASTGQPNDLPGGGASTTEVYNYKSGDYFIVKVAGNKVPSGTSIPVGTTVATFPSETGGSSEINDSIYFNGTTWAILHTPAGTGDVTGPASSTNNNLVAFDGTTGKLVKDSGISANDIVTTSKSAASGGRTKSLVTTGEKYTWNNKADDSNVVHKGSSTSSVQETIYGFKTFINGIHTGEAGLDIGATMISYNEGMRYLSLNTNSNTLRLQSMLGNIIIDANASDISLNGSNVNINTSSDIKLASSHNTVIHANSDGSNYKAYYYNTENIPATLEASHEVATIGDITAPQITPAGITQLVENKSYQITLTEDDAAILENTQNTLIKIVIPSPYSTLLGVSNAWIKRDATLGSGSSAVYMFSCMSNDLDTSDAHIKKLGTFNISHQVGANVAYVSIGKINIEHISHADNIENGGMCAIQQSPDSTTFETDSRGHQGTVLTPGATANYSTMFNGKSTAGGTYSTVFGLNTYANGYGAIAEGNKTYSNGTFSHAFGQQTTTEGANSATFGKLTIAKGRSQFVFGENNIEDNTPSSENDRGTYIEIVGNGTGDGATPSNARTLDWNGNEVLAGYINPLGGIKYLTSAPTSANTGGGLIIVVLNNEPSTKYDGYLYIIKNS